MALGSTSSGTRRCSSSSTGSAPDRPGDARPGRAAAARRPRARRATAWRASMSCSSRTCTGTTSTCRRCAARAATSPIVVPAGVRGVDARAGLPGRARDRDRRGDRCRRGRGRRRGGLALRVPAAARTDGAGVGFVCAASQSVYFAGDTDLCEGMWSLGDIDLALIPVWGWGPTLGRGLHLDPLKAAEALRRVRPRAAVPIHWGTYWPHAMGRVFPERLVEPPAAFVEYASELAPDVRCCRPRSATRWRWTDPIGRRRGACRAARAVRSLMPLGRISRRRSRRRPRVADFGVMTPIPPPPAPGRAAVARRHPPPRAAPVLDRPDRLRRHRARVRGDRARAPALRRQSRRARWPIATTPRSNPSSRRSTARRPRSRTPATRPCRSR